MEFGADRHREIEEVCGRRGVRSLALFGSAAGEDFDEMKSDLDFAVEFEPMEPVEHKRAFFGLLFDLESLFGRSVDLVEPKSVENPFIHESIESHKKMVYGAA